jgi:hypothetical protein
LDLKQDVFGPRVTGELRYHGVDERDGVVLMGDFQGRLLAEKSVPER